MPCDSGDNDSVKKTDPQTVIAVCALISVLYGLIHLAVAPIKSDIKRLEANMQRLELKVDKILSQQQNGGPDKSG